MRPLGQLALFCGLVIFAGTDLTESAASELPPSDVGLEKDREMPLIAGLADDESQTTAAAEEGLLGSGINRFESSIASPLENGVTTRGRRFTSGATDEQDVGAATSTSCEDTYCPSYYKRFSFFKSWCRSRSSIRRKCKKSCGLCPAIDEQNVDQAGPAGSSGSCKIVVGKGCTKWSSTACLEMCGNNTFCVEEGSVWKCSQCDPWGSMKHGDPNTGRCSESCPTGSAPKYQDSATCVKCSASKPYVEGTGGSAMCVGTCKDGHAPNSQKLCTQCKGGTPYADRVAHKCVQYCHKGEPDSVNNCLTCGSSDLSSYRPLFDPVARKCVKGCPTGKPANITTKICSDCPEEAPFVSVSASKESCVKECPQNHLPDEAKRCTSEAKLLQGRWASILSRGKQDTQGGTINATSQDSESVQSIFAAKDHPSTDTACAKAYAKNKHNLPEPLKCPAGFEVRNGSNTTLTKHMYVSSAKQCATFEYRICECKVKVKDNFLLSCPAPACSTIAPKFKMKKVYTGYGDIYKWIPENFEGLQVSGGVGLEAMYQGYAHSNPAGAQEQDAIQDKAGEIISRLQAVRGDVVEQCRNATGLSNNGLATAAAAGQGMKLDPCLLPYWTACAESTDGQKTWNKTLGPTCSQNPKHNRISHYSYPGYSGKWTKWTRWKIPSSKHWPDENQRCSDTNPLISQYMGYGASMLYDSGYNENARYASDHFNKARLAIGEHEPLVKELWMHVRRHMAAVPLHGERPKKTEDQLKPKGYCSTLHAHAMARCHDTTKAPLSNGVEVVVVGPAGGKAVRFVMGVPSPEEATKGACCKGPYSSTEVKAAVEILSGVSGGDMYKCVADVTVQVTVPSSREGPQCQTNGKVQICEPLVASSVKDMLDTVNFRAELKGYPTDREYRKSLNDQSADCTVVKTDDNHRQTCTDPDVETIVVQSLQKLKIDMKKLDNETRYTKADLDENGVFKDEIKAKWIASRQEVNKPKKKTLKLREVSSKKRQIKQLMKLRLESMQKCRTALELGVRSGISSFRTWLAKQIKIMPAAGQSKLGEGSWRHWATHRGTSHCSAHSQSPNEAWGRCVISAGLGASTAEIGVGHLQHDTTSEVKGTFKEAHAWFNE